MSTHYSLTDEAFESQFANGTMDPSLFSHEAHLRLAWIHISRHGIEKAKQNITSQIKAFATKNGDPDKYNETLTIAAVSVVNHFMKRSDFDSFEVFIDHYPQLLENFMGLVKHHYSVDIFTSPKARSTYIAPDLQPFD